MDSRGSQSRIVHEPRTLRATNPRRPFPRRLSVVDGGSSRRRGATRTHDTGKVVTVVVHESSREGGYSTFRPCPDRPWSGPERARNIKSDTTTEPDLRGVFVSDSTPKHPFTKRNLWLGSVVFIPRSFSLRPFLLVRIW